MSKFICISSETESVPVGTILEGCVTHNGARFILTKDSELQCSYGWHQTPRFLEGHDMPMEGQLWIWSPVPEPAVVKPTRNVLRGIKRKAKRNH